MERPIKTDVFFRGTPILGKHPYKIMRSWLPQVLYDPLSEDFLVRILMFVVPLIRFLKLLRHWVKRVWTQGSIPARSIAIGSEGCFIAGSMSQQKLGTHGYMAWFRTWGTRCLYKRIRTGLSHFPRQRPCVFQGRWTNWKRLEPKLGQWTFERFHRALLTWQFKINIFDGEISLRITLNRWSRSIHNLWAKCQKYTIKYPAAIHHGNRSCWKKLKNCKLNALDPFVSNEVSTIYWGHLGTLRIHGNSHQP